MENISSLQCHCLFYHFPTTSSHQDSKIPIYIAIVCTSQVLVFELPSANEKLKLITTHPSPPLHDTEKLRDLWVSWFHSLGWYRALNDQDLDGFSSRYQTVHTLQTSVLQRISDYDEVRKLLWVSQLIRFLFVTTACSPDTCWSWRLLILL